MNDFQKKLQEIKTQTNPTRQKVNDTLDNANKELQEAVRKLRERLGREDLASVKRSA